MTLATIITASDFGTLVESMFQSEVPQVSSSESDLGEPLQRYTTPAEIMAKARQCIEAGVHNYAFGFWYPSMKGQVIERKVTLDPPREGKTFRYSLGGWGIIHLHLYVPGPGTLQCRIAVNSETRAMSRQDRHPELGPTVDWDWRVVEAYAFRLNRKLAAMGPTAPVGQAAAATDAPAVAPRATGPWGKARHK